VRDLSAATRGSEVTPVEPSDLDQLREALAALEEDLRVANEQLVIIESQRVELAGQLQQVRAVVQRMAGEVNSIFEGEQR
jgi:hypothetical protein